jgi:hypothetical protein
MYPSPIYLKKGNYFYGLINKELRLLFFLLPLLLFPSEISGQEYKLHFDATYSTIFPAGKDLNKKDGVETVSLIKNYNYGTGISLNVTYNYSRFIKPGWMFEIAYFKDWAEEYFDIYQGASTDLWLTGPVVYKTLDKKSGDKSRFEIYAAPLFGEYKINLNRFYYIIHTPTPEPVPERHENGMIFGLKTGVKASQTVTKNIKISLRLDFSYLHLNPLLSSDRNLFFFSPGAGITVNIIRNKTYFILY